MVTVRARVYREWIAGTHQFISKLRRAVILNSLWDWLVSVVRIGKMVVCSSSASFLGLAACVLPAFLVVPNFHSCFYLTITVDYELEISI